MKNLTLLSTLLLALILPACKKDSDKISREDFLGTYQCTEQRTSPWGGVSNDVYSMDIIASALENQVVLHDLNDGEIDIIATINGNKLEFNEQYVNGEGILDGNILTLDYQVDEYYYSGAQAGNLHHCMTTCTKQ